MIPLPAGAGGDHIRLRMTRGHWRLGAVALFLGLATAVRYYFVTKTGERVIADLRKGLFERVLTLPDGFADGGDVLAMGERVYIGLSGRTDRTGAEALKRALPFGL